MMSLWDALRMNMMISYQELVRTFPSVAFLSKGKSMFKKGLTLMMLFCALFSGQLMAGHKGHEYLWVKNVDHQLRHEADSGLC